MIHRIDRDRRARRRLFRASIAGSLLVATFTACGSADSQSRSSDGVALIIKTTTNPFFVEIQQGAQERAVADGLQLTVASGTQDGDVDNQIQAIDAAIERGDKAIMITPSGPAVDGALKRARKAGIFVVALDTRPNDPAAADITYATDNFEAGRLTGAWAAEKMRAQCSRLLAMRGVPRLRWAISTHAPAVHGVFSFAAFTRTISASSSTV